MSDYGSVLNIKKKNGKISQTEAAALKKSLAAEIESQKFEDGMCNPFTCKATLFSDGTFHATLSEYWHGEGDAKENWDFGYTGDKVDGKKLETHMQNLLGAEYVVEWAFEDW